MKHLFVVFLVAIGERLEQLIANLTDAVLRMGEGVERLIGVCSILLGVAIYSPGQTHYWNGSNIVDTLLGAPDGVYDCLPSLIDNSTVYFPLCEHSAGHLHGTWRYDNSSGLVRFTMFRLCLVLLQNNIIVCAWEK